MEKQLDENKMNLDKQQKSIQQLRKLKEDLLAQKQKQKAQQAQQVLAHQQALAQQQAQLAQQVAVQKPVPVVNAADAFGPSTNDWFESPVKPATPPAVRKVQAEADVNSPKLPPKDTAVAVTGPPLPPKESTPVVAAPPLPAKTNKKDDDESSSESWDQPDRVQSAISFKIAPTVSQAAAENASPKDVSFSAPPPPASRSNRRLTTQLSVSASDAPQLPAKDTSAPPLPAKQDTTPVVHPSTYTNISTPSVGSNTALGEDDDFFKPVSSATVEHPKPEDDFAAPVTHTEEPKAPLTVTEQAVLNKISALTTNDNAAVTNGTAAPSSK